MPNSGCLSSHSPQGGMSVQGKSHCADATTLWAEGTIGAGQWTVTGTRSQTSVGTIRQIVRGQCTVLHSVT